MPSEQSLQVAVLVGSSRQGAFGPTVGRWIAGHARRRSDMTVELIDLAEADLPAAYPSAPSRPVTDFIERIDRADAFVVVTPEYNHGYPASLKQAIDLPRAEWRAKPIGFVSYGGMAGGVRAVEQLRQVFPEVEATTVRNTVSLHNVWSLFDESGQLRDPSGPDAAAGAMLDSLAWWAEALRSARHSDAVRLRPAS